MKLEIAVIAAVVAAACSLPGVFLVLRRMSLMSDAISHSVLFGIVIGFFAVRTFHSPILMVGAIATGVLTVFLSETLLKTRLLKEDAAIGLVFPALFSIGVILISRYAGNIHLDTDAVLTGEIALAPFERFSLNGVDLGPTSAWVMSGIGLLNAAFFILFYKELKLSTFDGALAAAFGFWPGLLHYGLMVMVSITAVGAFDSVGSILVVALMIAPAASAFLLTHTLSLMILFSLIIGVFNAISGVFLAFAFDTSISGTMASMCGITFLAAFLLAPHRGLLSRALNRRERKWVFASYMLAVHLFYHEGTEEEAEESRVVHFEEHMAWSPSYSARVIATGIRGGILKRAGSRLELTGLGRETARSLMNRG